MALIPCLHLNRYELDKGTLFYVLLVASHQELESALLLNEYGRPSLPVRRKSAQQVGLFVLSFTLSSFL